MVGCHHSISIVRSRHGYFGGCVVQHPVLLQDLLGILVLGGVVPASRFKMMSIPRINLASPKLSTYTRMIRILRKLRITI
jgi:hypothetical protein